MSDPVARATGGGTRAHLAWIILVIMSGAVLVNLGLTAWELHREGIQDPPYDPWGEFPEQQVLNPNKTLTVGESLIVAGEKCIESATPVISVGEVYWTSQEPRGATFLTGIGTSELQPGCTEFEFNNPMPAEVVQTVIADRGEERSWRVHGSQWPIDRNGHRGVEQTWRTEEFVITSEDQS